MQRLLLRRLRAAYDAPPFRCDSTNPNRTKNDTKKLRFGDEDQQVDLEDHEALALE